MAPKPAIPAASQPLPQRLMALAQTLQFGWFVGHLTLLLATLRYTISFIRFNTNTKTAEFSYRLAFISAAATYGIVVYKAYRARIKQVAGGGGAPGSAGGGRAALQGVGISMLGDENVQYLIMALIWLCSKGIFLAMLPFTIYSTFHFLTYLRTALIPAIVPPAAAAPAAPAADGTAAKTRPPQNAVSEIISKFVKSHYDTSMMIVANLEIALLIRLVLGCVIWVNSWILLCVYAVFLRVRMGQSAFLRQAMVGFEVRVDGVLADSRVPQQVRDGWRVVKDGVRRVGAMTDVGEMTGGKVGGASASGRGRKEQ